MHLEAQAVYLTHAGGSSDQSKSVVWFSCCVPAIVFVFKYFCLSCNGSKGIMCFSFSLACIFSIFYIQYFARLWVYSNDWSFTKNHFLTLTRIVTENNIFFKHFTPGIISLFLEVKNVVWNADFTWIYQNRKHHVITFWLIGVFFSNTHINLNFLCEGHTINRVLEIISLQSTLALWTGINHMRDQGGELMQNLKI